MGLDKFKWYGDEWLKKFKEAYAKDLERAAIHVTNEVKKTINRAKSPPSSAPGDPPNRLKGQLMRSLTWQVDKENLKAYVGSNLPYAKFLELGTQEMAARPYLRPTLIANYKKVSEILNRPKKV